MVYIYIYRKLGELPKIVKKHLLKVFNTMLISRSHLCHVIK